MGKCVGTYNIYLLNAIYTLTEEQHEHGSFLKIEPQKA